MPEVASVPVQRIVTGWLYQPLKSGWRTCAVTVGGGEGPRLRMGWAAGGCEASGTVLTTYETRVACTWAARGTWAGFALRAGVRAAERAGARAARTSRDCAGARCSNA